MDEDEKLTYTYFGCGKYHRGSHIGFKYICF